MPWRLSSGVLLALLSLPGDQLLAHPQAAQLAVHLIGIVVAGVLVLWAYQRAQAR
jgi:hypothetical protein